MATRWTRGTTPRQEGRRRRGRRPTGMDPPTGKALARAALGLKSYPAPRATAPCSALSWGQGGPLARRRAALRAAPLRTPGLGFRRRRLRCGRRLRVLRPAERYQQVAVGHTRWKSSCRRRLWRGHSFRGRERHSDSQWECPGRRAEDARRGGSAFAGTDARVDSLRGLRAPAEGCADLGVGGTCAVQSGSVSCAQAVRGVAARDLWREDEGEHGSEDSAEGFPRELRGASARRQHEERSLCSRGLGDGHGPLECPKARRGIERVALVA